MTEGNLSSKVKYYLMIGMSSIYLHFLVGEILILWLSDRGIHTLSHDKSDCGGQV